MRSCSLFILSITLVQLLVLRPTLCLAFSGPKSNRALQTLFHRMTASSNDTILPRRQLLDREKEEWITRSVDYYSKVMREERRRNEGQISAEIVNQPEYQEKYVILAKKHYFALKKIKTGNLHHAEHIYRRIINELLQEEDGECDHAKLAVTTLLLALLTQRMGDRKATRSVFLNFFRIAVLDNDDTECACSAKVLCAYALFEMRQGNARKAFELVKTAIKFDRTLTPVLQWKQFRDVATQKAS